MNSSLQVAGVILQQRCAIRADGSGQGEEKSFWRTERVATVKAAELIEE
jgi:hypothetical protein